MTLTVSEIIDLSRFAGLTVDTDIDTELDTELTIEDCPAQGVLQDVNLQVLLGGLYRYL